MTFIGFCSFYRWCMACSDLMQREW